MTYRPLPQDDPTQRKPDITRAREWLGWEPKIALSEGLAHTVEYFRQHADPRLQGRDGHLVRWPPFDRSTASSRSPAQTLSLGRAPQGPSVLYSAPVQPRRTPAPLPIHFWAGTRPDAPLRNVD